MEQVTINNLDKFIRRYHNARGSASNEDTHSEAMFFAIGPYCGCLMLKTGIGIYWVGLQNASSRFTNEGQAFASLEEAIVKMLQCGHPTFKEGKVYYSENAVNRLRWIADRIEEFKELDNFFFYTED